MFGPDGGAGWSPGGGIPPFPTRALARDLPLALIFALALLAAQGGAEGARAQVVPSDSTTPPPVAPPPLPPPPRDTVASLQVVARSRAPVEAMAILFPRGSGSDPEGAPGAMALLARALELEMVRRFVGESVLVGSLVEPGRTTLTLAAPQDRLESVWHTAREVLETPLPEAAIDGARTELLGPLRFERGAPVRLFELEFDRLLMGVTHPWARPAQGTEGGLESVTVGMIREMQLRWIRLEEARMAVVGPESREGIARLIGHRGEPAVEPSPAVPSTLAADGERARLVLEREVVNAWVAVAWPVAPGTPRTSLEFTAHVLTELLAPPLSDPGLFSLTARVDDLPDGPVLRVVAAVLPGGAPAWEERILEAVRTLGEHPPPPDFLALFRRRFASQVLLRESLPEAEAARRATDLARSGAGRDLAAELHVLGGEDISVVVDALGPPRVLLYGPPERASDR